MRSGWSEVIQEAEERGWISDRTKKGVVLKWPKGGMYHLHLCGNDGRALKHARKALKRIEEGRPAGAH